MTLNRRQTSTVARPEPKKMTEAERMLEAVRDYINELEHLDDWGVPCVYTKNLRILLGMKKSPL